MQIRTDDDVYRVDAVWLGPPRATFPWRARYSSYGVGLIVMIIVMFAQRRLGIDIGFFSVAWALLITVAVVRFVSKRINEDRPLLEWLTLFFHELRGPRRRTRGAGSTVGTGHIAIAASRPLAALPPGRSDPRAAMAVRERRNAVPDERPSRPRRRGRRSWTTREGTPTTPPATAPTPAGPSTPADPDGVLRVAARRADRPGKAGARRARTRPVAEPRRYGPSARDTPATPTRADEEADGAPGRA